MLRLSLSCLCVCFGVIGGGVSCLWGVWLVLFSHLCIISLKKGGNPSKPSILPASNGSEEGSYTGIKAVDGGQR